MNVLIIPYGETNAYHKLLSESLKIQGVKVKKGINTTFFPILRQTLSEKIDIIHIEWTDIFFIRKNIIYSRLRAYAFIFELLIIKKILKKKIAWRVHNRYNHEQLHLDLDLHVSRFLAYFSDLIEVECPNAKEEIIDLFSIENPSKIKIIPMGNYIGAYQNSISKKEAKEKIGIKDDNFAYLYFGKIRPYKGVFNLISAFKNFSRHEQDRLILAGRPKDAQLQSLIEDKIKN
ncbi:MAG: glycosyltransferase, partial [Candidatus Thermoplasmatota archaeon]|nr:glycosyltransferase [Candidatus Thermoplasmatota archaeon]